MSDLYKQRLIHESSLNSNGSTWATRLNLATPTDAYNYLRLYLPVEIQKVTILKFFLSACSRMCQNRGTLVEENCTCDCVGGFSAPNCESE